MRVAGDDRWVAAEDAARFRDALGVVLPRGVARAFLEPVGDPLGDLVARFGRARGPFVPEDAAARLGVGVAVIAQTLERLVGDGRIVEGAFRPGGMGREWIDTEVLRRVRRRSLAAFRKDVEAVPPETLARFTLAWQGLADRGVRRAEPDALLDVVEQLAGAPMPASVLERQVLSTRLSGYSPALLDGLGASGEVVWAGCGALGAGDGWVALAPADKASVVLPEPVDIELSGQAAAVRAALAGAGALFFKQIAQAVASTDDSSLLASLWELVWAGWVTNDTFAPLRAVTGGVGSVSVRRRPRTRGPSFPTRVGPPSAAGRWSLVRRGDTVATRRLHGMAEQLLARHGIVTRASLATERVPGGLAAVYPVLKAMEDSGRCRRGYFVEGLGGAQFAMPGAVDRLRALADAPRSEPST